MHASGALRPMPGNLRSGRRCRSWLSSGKVEETRGSLGTWSKSPTLSAEADIQQQCCRYQLLEIYEGDNLEHLWDNAPFFNTRIPVLESEPPLVSLSCPSVPHLINRHPVSQRTWCWGYREIDISLVITAMLDQDCCCSVVNRTATAGNVVSAYLRYIDCIFTSEFSRTATDVLGKGDCSEGRRQEKLHQMN